ncbi:hypothetical protein SLEP1_g42171 [Rubroshorea leprosula]|uniref:TPX2 central domain-containing protein n=1 Tax=Rubroshorea leprosula TaxID=152421 RepID=A0AAV5L9U0_9ROSI|nr:hypothetical protein SLEP1_g42171 [Rubroshorea leprosula]
MEEFFVIDEPVEFGEINEDLEFDAPQFYDFTRPETDWEAAEAQLWFMSAGSNPPSPFALKLKQRTVIAGESARPSSRDDGDCESMTTSSSNGSEISHESEVSALDYGESAGSHMDEDNTKAKTKSQVKPCMSRNSTLMKPTASHLAKQNQSPEVHSRQQLRRFKKLLVMFDDKSSKSSVIDGHAPKRQKLEAGYLRKQVTHMKHRVSFVHKTPKKVGSYESRHRVTVPREPELETARRAQQRSSKVKEESNGDPKPNGRVFKAQPLNRKILEAPLSLLPKRCQPPLPRFQEFHLRTSERAKQHVLNKTTKLPNYVSTSRNEAKDCKRLYSCNALKGRDDGGHEACPLSKKKLSGKGENDVFQNVPMGPKSPAEMRHPDEPPTELFNKLSLSSDVQPDMKIQSRKAVTKKGSKENAPVLVLQHEIVILEKENLQRIGGMQHRCRNESTKEIRPRLNINR